MIEYISNWAAMNTIMIFGTFDLLHEGHKFFIREAKQLGDNLVVVVARDFTVEKLKGQLPHENEIRRKMNIEQLHIADEVILGSVKDHLEAIKKYRPSMILLGYDQKNFTDILKKDLQEIGLEKTKVIRAIAHHPEIYKTSLIKKTHKYRKTV